MSTVSKSLRGRMGVDLGTSVPILEGLEWAADNEVHYVEFRLDTRSLDPADYPPEEFEEIRSICEGNDIRIGLHSSSAVNVAETDPTVRDSVDRYLHAYIDLAVHLNAARVVFHGGYHFTSDTTERKRASIDRLTRVGKYAEAQGIPIVICNMNPEPANSEIHYFCSTIDECREYSESVPDPAIQWAFNAPHANLLPEGIAGFLGEIDIERIGLVRLNDNRGIKEEHLPPGEGNIDFAFLLDELESGGYDGHYSLSWGNRREDVLEGREYLLQFV